LSAYSLVVEDGSAALARALDRQDRALILSDINMPGMSGLKTLPDVPVSMITARGNVGTRRKALERGAEKRPTRPIDVSVLRQEIKIGLGQAA
jgi:CheY-like chemotaxis protein